MRGFCGRRLARESAAARYQLEQGRITADTL
jgi:hypothetical protein